MKYTESDMADLLRWYYGKKPKNYGFDNYMYSTFKDSGNGYTKLSLRVPPPRNASSSVYQIWEAIIRAYTWFDIIEMKVIQDDDDPEAVKPN